jgi:hypothetical protein
MQCSRTPIGPELIPESNENRNPDKPDVLLHSSAAQKSYNSQTTGLKTHLLHPHKCDVLVVFVGCGTGRRCCATEYRWIGEGSHPTEEWSGGAVGKDVGTLQKARGGLESERQGRKCVDTRVTGHFVNEAGYADTLATVSRKS